ncbi:hypothetical protein ACFLQR_03840 [Verrucomicrobiota bacterium]
MYACPHIVKHAYTDPAPAERAFVVQLKWYCDVALMISQWDPDWRVIESRAKEYRVWNSVLFVSYLVSELLKTRFPQHVLVEAQRRFEWLFSRKGGTQAELLRLACNLPDSFRAKAAFWETTGGKFRLFCTLSPFSFILKRLRPHMLKMSARKNLSGRLVSGCLSVYRALKKKVLRRKC